MYVVKYKLPAGFTCEHCILHWSWLTGNRCNPSCVREDPLYPNCDRQRMGFCGSHGTRPDKYPEEVSAVLGMVHCTELRSMLALWVTYVPMRSACSPAAARSSGLALTSESCRLTIEEVDWLCLLLHGGCSASRHQDVCQREV